MPKKIYYAFGREAMPEFEVFEHASSGSGINPSPPFDTTGAKSLIVVVSDFNGSMYDNQSNVYSTLPIYDAGNPRVQVHYINNPTTSSSHVFYSGVNGFSVLFIFKLLKNIIFDAESGATGVASSLGTGSITLASGQKIVITSFCNAATSSITPPAGIFTATGIYPYFFQNHMGGAAAYAFTNSTASVSATWNQSVNTQLAVQIASFLLT